MLALGINEDLYGCGVALSDGQRLLFAANEERYSRKKNHGGFPHRSIAHALEYSGVDPRDISHVCATGITTPHLLMRFFPSLLDGVWESQSSRSTGLTRSLTDAMVHQRALSIQRPRGFIHGLQRRIVPGLIRQALPPVLRHAQLHLTKHHDTHLWCAYALSGFDAALGITADGMGDGLSLTVSTCDDGAVKRLHEETPDASLGLFFEALTEAFGFVPGRDEGKLTGLAAHGDPGAIDVPIPFSVHAGRLRYRGPHGLKAVLWAKEQLLARHSREDVAAWAQQILDDCMVGIARHWLQETGMNRLVLGGGLFANVKLNQRLHELPEVRQIFVAPNMGDGGNPVGALASKGFLARGPIQDVFLGEAYSDADYTRALAQAGLVGEVHDDPAGVIAEQLASGKIVARLDSRMEWGPRALGNRSILAAATDPHVVARLNNQLRRSDFMPFAPALMAEEVPRFLKNYDSGLLAGEFMTTCYQCTEEMHSLFPAVVHVDGTARAQVVRREANPGFHAILSAYRENTGAGVLLNTSFNIHEEPIVCTPEEAIASFQTAGLDCLALGPYLVCSPGAQ